MAQLGLSASSSVPEPEPGLAEVQSISSSSSSDMAEHPFLLWGPPMMTLLPGAQEHPRHTR